MRAARIAVVVPVYNAAEYLPLCLDSIAAQSFSQFCCVLADDGSTDGSGALCDTYARRDPRFEVLHLQNGGTAAARAAGVRAVSCEYLAFCDADDLLHPRFLETLLHAAEQSGLPIACCRYDTFTDAPSLNGPAPESYTEMEDPRHLEALLHDHAVDYSLCNKLYDANLMRPEFLDNGLAHNEDLLANWEAFLLAPGMVFCDFAGYHYRQHAASASHHGLTAGELADHRAAAAQILAQAPDSVRSSAGAFYYEKLTYLVTRILRLPEDAGLAPALQQLTEELRRGEKDPLLGANSALPRAVRIAARAAVHTPRLLRLACRLLLRDRA
ncbi:glycosyltransferase [Subdoligranulum sp. DSM 109015]|uniref:Glycosyltransferase n=1 Tax=Gemmiger gallinarum TaxID=2779354 RepID=A0ABR9R4T2_9FIRM|nr:glycosyltransferase [Gemmiger gallinarum]MBE5038146.1 glycosyltransferase [Gemmiger gallinarum]